MRQKILSKHDATLDGLPSGGMSSERGIEISWQSGPLVDEDTGERKEPDGEFVDGVIAAAVVVPWYSLAMRRRISVAVAAIALTGCFAAPQLRDEAIGTIVVPDDTDCQYRRAEGVISGGFGATFSGQVKTLTVAGPSWCSEPETLSALDEFL